MLVLGRSFFGRLELLFERGGFVSALGVELFVGVGLGHPLLQLGLFGVHVQLALVFVVLVLRLQIQKLVLHFLEFSLLVFEVSVNVA